MIGFGDSPLESECFGIMEDQTFRPGEYRNIKKLELCSENYVLQNAFCIIH